MKTREILVFLSISKDITQEWKVLKVKNQTSPVCYGHNSLYQCQMICLSGA